MSVNVADKVLWTSLKYLGAAFAPVFWFAMALHLTGRAHWLTPVVRVVLGTWAIALLVVVASNAWHLSFWQQFYIEPGFIESRTVHGPLFNLYTIPSYVLIIASAVCYVDFYRRTANRFQPRSLLLVAASLVPVVADLLQQSGLKILPQVDQVPLSLLVSSIMFAIVVLRYRALEILPIARDLVIQNIAAAVIVLNNKRQILEVNPFAFDLARVDEPLDKSLDEVYPEFSGLPVEQGFEQEIEVATSTGNRWLFFRASEVRESKAMGLVLVGLDITERKLAEQELERRATTDPLTGVANRRAFFEQAEAELLRAKRAGDDLAVLMIDIDYFKKINDSKGHQAGDEVLVMLAQRAVATLREVDIVARYGGEEFIALLAGDAGGVLQSAERLRAAFDGVPIATNAGDIAITISIGVAFVESLDDPLEATIEKADAALYESKDQGRNRVTLFDGTASD
jgi:diguanylate cyclase (GGDEF)-like protein